MLAKTGVEVPEGDISECHPLGRPGAAPNTVYKLVFNNRKPGSAWDILSSGLLTGKNRVTKQYFKNDVTLNINFQLTKNKRELLKLVGEARRNRKIKKYGTDQNGRITVRVHANSSWEEVRSAEELARVQRAAGPPDSVNSQPRRNHHRR